MIYITGDTHSSFERLSSRNCSAKSGDYIIICGDFGGIWDGSRTQMYWLDWLSEKPFTVLFADGNHENFDLLAEFPIENRFGGKVHRVTANVFHLMRGEIFELEGKSFFVMGGAQSHDIGDGILDPSMPDFELIRRRFYRERRNYRINHFSWWKEELPSEAELSHGLESLAKYDNKVDFVITHCAPTSVQAKLSADFTPDRLTDYLEHVREACDFENWFFGHYHGDLELADGFHLLYRNLIPLE